MPLLDVGDYEADWADRIKRLTRYFVEARGDIASAIIAKSEAGTYTGYLKEKQRQIEEILSELNSDSRGWLRPSMNEAFREGVDMVIEIFQLNGSEVSIGAFADIQRQAVNLMVGESMISIEQATSNVVTRLDQQIRALQLDVVTKGIITGATTREIAKEFKQRMEEANLTEAGAFRGGMDAYSKMVGRTALANASRAGTLAALNEAGRDLVIVIGSGEGSCEKCNPWVGAVLSISGKTSGYPSVREAESSGLGHPNCVHDYAPYVDRFATKEQITRAQERTAGARAYLKAA
jgi:23S rRNA pseudoU1915 N3-methylase RlmH